jgi:UDP-N-acetyl-2-amino-2-deoxyglucuronate dehydrogenase
MAPLRRAQAAFEGLAAAPGPHYASALAVSTPARNFAITGVAGYVAPRHLEAIRDTGNRLVAACDPRDSVGVLDRFSEDARFFTEIERFDRHLEKLRRGPEDARVHFLSVCSPSYLHDAHCRLGMRVGADVICEKPVVLSPWNVDALAELEAETGRRVYTVLQLREHERLVALRERLAAERGPVHDVELDYVTARGPWFDVSWKGVEEKSGGLATGIGIHFFDLLPWLFGPVESLEVHLREPRRVGGVLRLERARVRWFLSVEAADLPEAARRAERSTHRSIRIDGTEVEFSEGFSALHTRVYARVLEGKGLGLADARASIQLAYDVRRAECVAPSHGDAHRRLRP